MSLAFYMDEQVPQQITAGLRLRGIDVLTVQEDGRAGTPDPLVLNRAAQLQRLMVSRDQDFLIEASQRQATGVYFPGVIYAHQQQVSIGDCIRNLELIAKAGSPEEFANQVIYLPL